MSYTITVVPSQLLNKENAMEYVMRCFKCHTKLTNCDIGIENQPEGGICIESTGHFGSAVIDSVDGDDRIRLFICDDCLSEALKCNVACRFDASEN